VARLHQEILDFYEWVRPHDFEQEIRLDVISRLQKTFSRLEPGCQLKPFGSFAAGLYLPTGDMDLVLMTRGSFRPRGAKPLFWFIHSILERENITVAGSLQPIAKAKVPIIKFVDAITGLKVDLSFNNETGIVANNTFHQWKAQYPTMPVLVSVIKQFLMIRGLNDVAFGGLGGFSTICLVTSLIQHHILPGQIPNLGDLLLNFFWFYGHVFNKQEIAIRLEPPGYVRKVGWPWSNLPLLTRVQDQYDPFLHNNDRSDRLAIVDPNKADNNISGGTAEIDMIIKCFRQAYKDLQAQMTRREQSGQESSSLMSDLIGGDYDAYALQRERLRRIYSNKFARGNQPLPPTVSLSGPPGVALPNATAAGKKQSNVVKGPRNQANGHRRASGKDSTL
jgi:non-canonical poly(A) RNA polymerase PAPD5/7